MWRVDTPYLRAVDDSRWEMASSDPAANRSWAKGFSWSTLATKLGFTSISAISVPARNSSARVSGVQVTGVRSGSTVTTHLDGWDVRQSLGRLSPGFEISAAAHIGGSGATPVVGDWDGNGSTTAGVRRGRSWLLRDRLCAGALQRSFRYGRKADRPMAGDWDGNGTVTAGVVRDLTFYLRNGAGGGKVSGPVAFAG